MYRLFCLVWNIQKVNGIGKEYVVENEKHSNSSEQAHTYVMNIKTIENQQYIANTLFSILGLELLKSEPSTTLSQLYYWQREKQGSLAEVDYVMQCQTDIVPLEVKSGTKGSMQSLFQFLSEKKYPYGIRCSMENFNLLKGIKVYPRYAVSNIKNRESESSF